jgi:hypothetical protein
MSKVGDIVVGAVLIESSRNFSLSSFVGETVILSIFHIKRPAHFVKQPIVPSVVCGVVVGEVGKVNKQFAKPFDVLEK